MRLRLLSIFLLGCLDLFSQSNPDSVYTVVENMPEFPGGQDALYKYLVQNAHYPAKERAAGISGKVYIQFTVNKSGNSIDVHPMKEVQDGPGLTEEAVRVVKNLPAWKPGQQNGKPVSVSMILPIKFSIPKAIPSISANDDFIEVAQQVNAFKKVKGTYVNFDYHFSIILPEYYRYIEKYNHNELYSFNSGISKDSLEMIAVSLERKADTLASVNKQIMAGMKKQMTIIGEIKTMDFSLSGYEAKKNVYAVEFSGRNAIVTTYIFISRKYTFDISTCTYADQYETLKDKMENCVQTVFVE